MTVLKISNKEVYRLEADFNSMVLVEEVTGEQGEILINNGFGFIKTRAFLYAALMKYHRDVTLEECGNICGRFVKENGFDELVTIVLDEYKKAGCLGNVEEDNDNATAEKKINHGEN